MKFSIALKATLLSLVLVPVLALGATPRAHAQIPYQEGVSSTSPTPIFNQYTGVPVTGDEADFVRVRASTGDPRFSAGTTPFVDPANASCEVGDQFDVRSYVHNGASQALNGNGDGTAVAHNTTIALTAPLNSTSKKFEFGSTISASNAASVTDKGTLNCDDNVQLVLVPHTVYSSTTGGWVARDDSAVNGSMKIGSVVADSGDMWACWDFRVMVVYTVKVVEAPKPVVPAFSCDLLTVSKLADNKFRFKLEKYTATNGAVLKDVTYRFGDGTTVTAGVETDHTYSASSDSKKAVAIANFTVGGAIQSQSSDKCTAQAQLVAAIVKPTTPTTLPVTGAGGTVVAFFGTSAVGAFIYRMRMLRRSN